MQTNEQIPSLELLLKVLEDDDIIALWDVICEHKSELRPWLDWVDAVHSYEEYHSYMNRIKYEESIGIQKHFVLSVNGKASGEIVFDDFDARTKSCNLGYWISPQYQKLGIMYTACSIAITKAFESLNISKINIKFIGSNKASLGLGRKLGFKIDGVLRKNILYQGKIEDEVLMSLFRSEWHFSE